MHFRVNSATFLLTYAQCPKEKENLMEFLIMKFKNHNYIVVCQETHEDGNFHLHAFIQNTKRKDVTNSNAFDWFGYHPNIIGTKTVLQSIEYVKKHSNFIEVGSPILPAKKKTAMAAREERAAKNKLILETPLTELVDNGDISIFSFLQLQKCKDAYKMAKIKPSSMIDRTAYWIYGAPGIGKSYWVRSHYPLAFPKPQNKWWDGYCDESTVLLDDFDCDKLHHSLKIWADKYSFVSEYKGASIYPSYTTLFLTSNSLPSDLWSGTQLDAITRRFIICTIHNRELVTYPGLELIKIGDSIK